MTLSTRSVYSHLFPCTTSHTCIPTSLEIDTSVERLEHRFEWMQLYLHLYDAPKLLQISLSRLVSIALLCG
jgi:hypothetical protein